ncbi:MAG: preprotein translocase subunit YajC [Clostridiales bacterium]|jgi:preprotein translocase subunit YajC|nr:preprotein translocase subunit YajC [Clostridiales bacterium]
MKKKYLFSLTALIALSMLFLTACQKTDGEGIDWMQTSIMIVILVLIIGAMFVMPMFTRKKQQKQFDNAIGSIHVGDVVKTIGGFIGTVVYTGTEQGIKIMVIKTGEPGSETTMKFDMQAFHSIVHSDYVAPAKEEPQVADVKEAPAADAATEEAPEDESK